VYKAIDTALQKSASIFAGNSKSGASAAHGLTAAFAMVRGRRKEDLMVIAIGVLLALLFFAQLGWLILNRSHPQL